MTSAQNESQALGDLAARQLANATKTVPQLSTITPRFLLHLLSWVPVEAGIYRVNRVVNPDQVALFAEEGSVSEEPLPQTYVDYETAPREYTLRAISTLLDVHTAQPGDYVVIVAGTPAGTPGSTNTLRIHQLGSLVEPPVRANP